MLEWYAAYWDYRDNMTFIRELIQAVLDEFTGATSDHATRASSSTSAATGPCIDYRDAVRERTGIDLRPSATSASSSSPSRRAEHGLDPTTSPSYAALVDCLYKRTVRPHLIQPCFLVAPPRRAGAARPAQRRRRHPPRHVPGGRQRLGDREGLLRAGRSRSSSGRACSRSRSYRERRATTRP